MKRLQRMTWGVHFLAPALLALPSCSGVNGWGSSESCCAGATPVEPNCTDWNAYDPDWHRCHWGERGINWCNAPLGYTETVDAGSTGTGTSGSGTSTTADAGETASPDGATGSGGSGATADSGTASSSTGTASSGTGTGAGGAGGAGGADASSTMGAGDIGQAITCTVGATCPAGNDCVSGSCQPCVGGVCACQRDDDCPANQICDHTAGTCTQPPPACTALTTEAACVARADCIPIYGGMSCTNSAGDACQSGEANCTCATYAFAACIARSP